MGLQACCIPMVLLTGLSVMYAMFMGDPSSGSPQGRFTFFVTCWLPHHFPRIMRKICGERVSNGVGSFFEFLFFKRNPFLQIVYAVLVLGGYMLLVWEAYPKIPNLYMDEYHRYTGIGVWGFTVASFYMACLVSAGRVTQKTWKDYDVYAYDNVMFQERTCSTCLVPKPARSKHCRVCNICIPRFDHHCGWLNQCVGQKNYKYFLLFLFSNAIMLCYGALAMGCVLASIVKENRLFESTFVHRETKEKIPGNWRIVLQFMLSRYSNIFMLLILCGVMGIVIVGFFLYHVWLAASGQTTNESAKRGDVAHAVRENVYLVKKREQQREEAKAAQSGDAQAGGGDAEPEERLMLSVPPNIYNLGWRANLAQVLSPPGKGAKVAIAAWVATKYAKEGADKWPETADAGMRRAAKADGEEGEKKKKKKESGSKGGAGKGGGGKGKGSAKVRGRHAKS